jgi:hypothetical protein
VVGPKVLRGMAQPDLVVPATADRPASAEAVPRARKHLHAGRLPVSVPPAGAREDAQLEPLPVAHSLALSLPDRRAAVLALKGIREHVRAVARRNGFGQVALEHRALTSQGAVGIMLSRQKRAAGRPECWHLAISEWRDGQRHPAGPSFDRA